MTPRLISIQALALELERAHPGAPLFSRHALNHLVCDRHKNGLAPYTRKVGRRVLVDRLGFYKWLDSHKERAA